jgi:hypothetical protein
MKSWQSISNTQLQQLTEARLQLHYAVQFIAMTSAAFAEALPDDSHTSLEWYPDLKVFVGAIIRCKKRFRVALDPISLTLMLLDHRSETVASLPLQGKTMSEGLIWLKQEISRLGVDASSMQLPSYPQPDFPDHPLAHGACFDASQASALSALANDYARTHQLLETIIANTEDASAVRIWPHHFDIATLIMLPGIRNGQPLTVGVGMSPGDVSYPEPYWYVSPSPDPDPAHLPALDGSGFWHTQDWVGAILKASQLPPESTAQTQQIERFLQSALNAAIALLQSNFPAKV